MNRLLVAVALVALPGCAYLRPFLEVVSPEPSVTFARAGVVEASLEGMTLEVVFVAENPGELAIQVDGVEARLLVDGKVLPLQPAQSRFSIPPHGRAELRLPARIDVADLQRATPLAYSVEGAVAATLPLGPQRFPLSHAGQLEPPRAPTAALGAPRLTSLSLAGAALEVPVEIANPNGFSLSQLGFSAELSIAGRKVAAISKEDLGPLAPSERRTVSLPISFTLATLAASSAQLAEAPAALEGTLRSGKVSVPVRWNELLRVPTIAFKEVRYSDLSLEGVGLDIVFEASNPSDLSISLGNLRGGVRLDGRQVAVIGSELAPVLAPGFKGDVSIPLRFKLAETAGALAALLQKKTAAVAVDGSLALPTVAGTRPSPFAHSGALELPQLPKLALAPPKISQLTFTTATLEVPVEVTNPNAFALPVSSVAGALSISGLKVGSLATGDLGRLEPGAKRTVVLPVTFELLRAASAATALRTGTAALAFDGSLQTGQLAVPVKWAETVQLTR